MTTATLVNDTVILDRAKDKNNLATSFTKGMSRAQIKLAVLAAQEKARKFHNLK